MSETTILVGTLGPHTVMNTSTNTHTMSQKAAVFVFYADGVNLRCVSEALTLGSEPCHRGTWVIAMGCPDRHLPSVAGSLTIRPRGEVNTHTHKYTHLTAEFTQNKPIAK